MANRGKLQYEVAGRKVYANPDAMHDPYPDKTKAFRKMVRMIIEKEGGDGATIKKDISTIYCKGKVWFKDNQVAEWDDRTKTMKLSGVVACHQKEYDDMMATKRPE